MWEILFSFFVAIFLHEMAHYAVAKWFGLQPSLLLWELEVRYDHKSTDMQTRLVGLAPIIFAFLSLCFAWAVFDPVPVWAYVFVIGLVLFTSGSDLSIDMARGKAWKYQYLFPGPVRIAIAGVVLVVIITAIERFIFAHPEISKQWLLLLGYVDVSAHLIILIGFGWWILISPVQTRQTH